MPQHCTTFRRRVLSLNLSVSRLNLYSTVLYRTRRRRGGCEHIRRTRNWGRPPLHGGEIRFHVVFQRGDRALDSRLPLAHSCVEENCPWTCAYVSASALLATFDPKGQDGVSRLANQKHLADLPPAPSGVEKNCPWTCATGERTGRCEQIGNSETFGESTPCTEWFLLSQTSLN